MIKIFLIGNRLSDEVFGFSPEDTFEYREEGKYNFVGGETDHMYLVKRALGRNAGKKTSDNLRKVLLYSPLSRRAVVTALESRNPGDYVIALEAGMPLKQALPGYVEDNSEEPKVVVCPSQHKTKAREEIQEILGQSTEVVELGFGYNEQLTAGRTVSKSLKDIL